MLNKHVVVPVHLDAVVVPEDRYVLSAMADFSKLPYCDGKRDVNPDTAYLSEEIVARPFVDQSWPLNAGVHLHWTLPDALTKTMGMPVVRRQAFYAVFGKARGHEIWDWLLDAEHGWLSIIDDYTAMVVQRDHRKPAVLPARLAGELAYIQQLLTQHAFPAVPNRWLVVRYHNGQSTSWVVESDYLFNDPKLYDPDRAKPIGSVPFPVDPNPISSKHLPGVPFRYMGRRVPLETWKETKSLGSKDFLGDPLTAVGYGEPNFAAFYPNCHSVFGFYDDKIKPTSDQLNGCKYTLCGWYDDLKHDYLNFYLTRFKPNPSDARPKNIQLHDSIHAEFGWSLPITVRKQDLNLPGHEITKTWDHLIECKWIMAAPHGDQATVLPIGTGYEYQLRGEYVSLQTTLLEKIGQQIESQLPRRILCHAQLDFQDVNNTDAVTEHTHVQVAVGNTGTEALATYLTAKIKESKSVDAGKLAAITEHLEAAQLASQLDNKILDVGPRYREAIHTKGFNGTGAGTVWTVQKRSAEGQRADAEDAHGKSQMTLAPEMAHRLNVANRLQQDYDRAKDEIDSLRHQIYADWCKYLISMYPPADDLLDYQNVDRIKHFLQHHDLQHLKHKIKTTGLLLLKRDREGHVTFASANRKTTLADRLAKAINNVIGGFSDANRPTTKTIDFVDFSNHGKLNLVGDAKVVGQALRLTPSQGGQAGAAWFQTKQPVDRPFSTTFQFQITEPGNNGADGIAFVVQNSNAAALGGGGGGIGYDSIPNALAVEFDTWTDIGACGDPNDNHIAVLTRGELPISCFHKHALGVVTTNIPTLQIGTHTVTIDYKPGELAVSINDRGRVLVVTVDLANKLALDQDGKAWVGLTSGTGAAWENHDVLCWSFQTIRPATSAEFVLDRAAAPRYWQPNEPVVLLAGDDAKYTARYGQDGIHQEAGQFVCRIDENKFSNPPVVAELKEMIGHLKQSLGSEGIGYNKWQQQTWHPFMLEWAVDVHPTRDPHHQRYDEDYDPDYLAANYQLPVEDVEFKPTQTNVGVVINPRSYTGFSILTPHVGEQLRHDLERELSRLSHPAIIRAYYNDKIKKGSIPDDDELLSTHHNAFNTWAGQKMSGISPLKKNAAEPAFAQIQKWIKANMKKIVSWLASDPTFDVKPSTIDADRTALRNAVNTPIPDSKTIENAEQKLHQDNVDYSLRVLAESYAALEKGDYLAQGLGGFNDALLGRKRTLQLPVADPLGFRNDNYLDRLKVGKKFEIQVPGDQEFADMVAAAVLNANRSCAATL